MHPFRQLPHVLRSARAWISLGVLAPLGMLVVSILMLLDMRHEAWTRAEQTSTNLLQVIERDISRNVEMYDLSLRAVVGNLQAPGVDQVSPELRQLILFDRAATARDMGVMLVIDENGDSIIDADAVPARKANYADRDYFQAHKAQADLGLVISRPLTSKLTGVRMIALSRRVDKPDGSFGGVVLGTLKLSYFERLFDRLHLGQDGAINLYLRDGTRIMRQPSVGDDIGTNIAGAATFTQFVSTRSGTFVGTSVRDGVERYYAFTQLGDLPLVLNVALSTTEIEAAWRTKAYVIGAVATLLCGLTIALSLLFGSELRRREKMQSELALLSRTDALTGLANRRAFEEAFDTAWADARRSGRPLSLLLADADHFKRFNDGYGHQVGDEVLRRLAQCLSASVHRPHDFVGRMGGEEFAMLLPQTDGAGARRLAERVHAMVAALEIASSGIVAGSVTVSVGLAWITPDGPSVAAEELFRMADAAVYQAKHNGRNRTECASIHSSIVPAGERPAVRTALAASPQRRSQVAC